VVRLREDRGAFRRPDWALQRARTQTRWRYKAHDASRPWNRDHTRGNKHSQIVIDEMHVHEYGGERCAGRPVVKLLRPRYSSSWVAVATVRSGCQLLLAAGERFTLPW
jgi:hypothetical protein